MPVDVAPRLDDLRVQVRREPVDLRALRGVTASGCAAARSAAASKNERTRRVGACAELYTGAG